VSIDEFGIRQVDGYYALSRHGGEEYDLRYWITPNDPEVMEHSRQLWDADMDTFILNCWYWVCSEFPYRSEFIDYWYLPAEVLRAHDQYIVAIALHNEMRLPVLPPRIPGYDCDDLTYTLASLLIAGGADAYANIGYHGRYDKHAWVTVVRDGIEWILESTLSQQSADILLRTNPWMLAETAIQYRPVYRFNNITVEEVPK